MTIRDMIETLERFAAQLGDDAEFILFDRTTTKVLRVDPVEGIFDFEVLRGDGVVVEFSS